jgi:hypothetical protein
MAGTTASSEWLLWLSIAAERSIRMRLAATKLTLLMSALAPRGRQDDQPFRDGQFDHPDHADG